MGDERETEQPAEGTEQPAEGEASESEAEGETGGDADTQTND